MIPTKRVLILDCYVDDPGGAPNFTRHLRGPEITTCRLTKEPLPCGAEDVDGIMITGSAASVVDGAPWIAPALSLLQRAVSDGRSVLGVCFGHQLVARALYGEHAVRRSPQPGLGWEDIDLSTTDSLFEGIPKTIRTFVSHFDEVSPDVDGLQVIGSSRRCPVHAFRHGRAPVWGVQFHAEMKRDETDEVVRQRTAKRPQFGDAEALLSRAEDSSPVIEAMIENFVASMDSRHPS